MSDGRLDFWVSSPDLRPMGVSGSRVGGLAVTKTNEINQKTFSNSCALVLLYSISKTMRDHENAFMQTSKYYIPVSKYEVSAVAKFHAKWMPQWLRKSGLIVPLFLLYPVFALIVVIGN